MGYGCSCVVSVWSVVSNGVLEEQKTKLEIGEACDHVVESWKGGLIAGVRKRHLYKGDKKMMAGQWKNMHDQRPDKKAKKFKTIK